MRVQDVFNLVEWIASYEPGWEQPGRAQEIVDAGQPVDVNLTRPLPVYFTYITAWAERTAASSSAPTSTAAMAPSTPSPRWTATPTSRRPRRHLPLKDISGGGSTACARRRGPHPYITAWH